MTFMLGIFQFHCKSEHKQVKWNKIKQDTSTSDSIFSYLQSSVLFKWLLKFTSWLDLFQNTMVKVLQEKCSLFNFNL